MAGFAMSRNGSTFVEPIGLRGALVSASRICGEPGPILNTRITRGLQCAPLDTVPRDTGKVIPLVH